jgi:hypothetical protein
MRASFLFILSALTTINSFAQDSLKGKPSDNELKQKAWASIFAAYYSTLTGSNRPSSAFEMPTALLGYSASLNETFKATLIYDVTRTTNNIAVTDSLGKPLNVTYNEGSRYTAFLKMAEIRYSPASFVDLRVGQLLNTQYLTTQDKFWGYRYIYFTFQEVHRYGNPADFGAQVDFKYRNMLLTQLSVTNGDGPFKQQDSDSKFLYSLNVEYYPINGAIVKVYSDFSAAPKNASGDYNRSALSVFAGFKGKRYRLAAEYNGVKNYGFTKNSDYWGISSFFSYSVTSKVDVLTRYDYINHSAPLNLSRSHFILAGIHYSPIKNLSCSVNLRHFTAPEKTMLYVSFGANF